MTQFVTTNGIRLAYSDYGGEGLPCILSHGLTANRQSFAGLIRAGLAQKLHVIAVDLRGRGDSDKPPTGYRMADHAADLIGLLDALGWHDAIFAGHSFGGLLSLYTAVHYPQRVRKVVIMDVGLAATKPDVLPKIKPSLERLGKVLPSVDAYIGAMQQSPYYADGFWDSDLEDYYRADVELLPDGGARARTTPDIIEQAVQGVLSEAWQQHLPHVTQPTLLIHANAPFGTATMPPILTDEGAQETLHLIPNCQYQHVGGHHITMLFGANAPQVAQAIARFCLS